MSTVQQDAVSTVSSSKKRGKVYKRKKAQFKGSKERLRMKCIELKQSCAEVVQEKLKLESNEAQLLKENLHLKRYEVALAVCFITMGTLN